MTKKLLLIAFGAGAMYLMFGLFTPVKSNAEVNVNIDIPLPGLAIPVPPALVVIPGTYVYYPPDVNVDIFFYHGYWYRPYRNRWFISSGYNGPWRGIGRGRVPHALIKVPLSTYRRMPPGHERMPHEMVQRNWRTWERERHWDATKGKNGGPGHGRDHGKGKHDND